MPLGFATLLSFLVMPAAPLSVAPRPLRSPSPRACASASPGDPIRLADARRLLLSVLEAAPPADAASAARSGALQGFYESEIAPLEPAIWRTGYSNEERQSAIVQLSCSLDALEREVAGPLLTGRSPTAADGLMYPSFCLFYHALPVHFGWTEWTDEALFFKRPRLHAWFELMEYERALPVGDIRARVKEDIAGLSFDWATPVPTLSHRKVTPDYD